MSDATIEVVGAVKRFGSFTAVNQVSFTVNRGECYGLIGPNGAGKTTTFSMICGFLYPSEGAVRVLGVDPSTPGALKGKVGVLPQDSELPQWLQVGELLTYWARLSHVPEPEKEARAALEKVQLADQWSTRARALSHGMAKRIALAQALMGAPPVVLLDEPTAGLDPKVAAHVRTLIREMRGAQTVIVSSHNLNELEELCDGAAILDRGRLVASGSMAELTSRAAEFRVRIARGEPSLGALRAIPGITQVRVDDDHVLHVQYDGAGRKTEDVVTEVLKLLISQDVYVLDVSRGRKLEEKVLQLT